jgi:hypothetical protein
VKQGCSLILRLQAELDLCSSAQAFLKDELNVQRTRIKARALAKVFELQKLQIPLFHIIW